MDSEQSKFEGWAIVELFGKNKTAGYVTTEYFGSAAMFRVDVPELPEREVTLSSPTFINSPEYVGSAPEGSVVKRTAEQGFTRMIGPGAVYAINPCTEQAVREFIEQNRKNPIVPVKIAERHEHLESVAVGSYESDDDESPF